MSEFSYLILKGYILKVEDNKFKLGNIFDSFEFKAIMEVEIELELEMSGSFIHDNNGNSLNFNKSIKINAWKGTKKRGKKWFYFITEDQLDAISSGNFKKIIIL